MKYLWLCLLLFLISCKKTDGLISESNPTGKKLEYKEFLETIGKKDRRQKSTYLFRFINNDVPQYWHGTTWSFAGTSR
ncbi:hypothetical protein [Chryseobacterium hagamense]|uniref:hypothetical protein n=1 Tax=Chryseobacterium hagamense TaxID=395935 RepID=UPI0011BFDA8B|nr:hypothetical protein [Chryseobacterium hagamense]